MWGAMESLRCANCEAPIGKLQTPYVWREQIICPDCYERLAQSPPAARSATHAALSPPPLPAVAPHSAAGAVPFAHSMQPGDIICPNPRCGYVGPAMAKAKGSVGLGCLLMIFFLIPGILYFLFTQGFRYSCPRCGVFINSD